MAFLLFFPLNTPTRIITKTIKLKQTPAIMEISLILSEDAAGMNSAVFMTMLGSRFEGRSYSVGMNILPPPSPFELAVLNFIVGDAAPYARLFRAWILK